MNRKWIEIKSHAIPSPSHDIEMANNRMNPAYGEGVISAEMCSLSPTGAITVSVLTGKPSSWR